MPLPELSPRAKHALELADAERALVEGLVKVRHENGLRAVDVARRIDRHKASVSRFEALEGDPRLSTVFRYALAVGARVSIKVDPYTDWSSATLGLGHPIEMKSHGWTGATVKLVRPCEEPNHA